jgi:hypothetical protein
MLCGLVPLIMAILNAFLLINHPQEKGLHVTEIDPDLVEAEKLLIEEGIIEEAPETEIIEIEEEQRLLDQPDAIDNGQAAPVHKGINFISAWKVPGVLGYSLSYLCLKFSAYGLMLWLPSYVS